MNYYLNAFKNYANFSGRASRKDYWMFALINFLVILVLELLPALLGNAAIVLVVLYMLAVFIPTLSIVWRRLHDINKSGGWYFISLIPLIGGIWLLVLLCKAGDDEANRFGENPKAIIY